MIHELKDDTVRSLQASLAPGEQPILSVRGGGDTAIVATDLRVFLCDRGFFGPKVYAWSYAAIESVGVRSAHVKITLFAPFRSGKEPDFMRMPALHYRESEMAVSLLERLIASRSTDLRRSFPWPSPDFDCDRCGRLSSTWEAVALRLRTARASLLALKPWQWDMLQQAADRDNPLRPGGLERLTGVTYDQATAGLEDLERRRLLVQHRNGYVRGALMCAECMRPSSAAPPVRPVRESIPAQLRFAVLQRDGFRCTYCGATQRDGAVLHVDHVVPHSRGGSTTEGNLVTACQACNLGKAAASLFPEDS